MATEQAVGQEVEQATGLRIISIENYTQRDRERIDDALSGPLTQAIVAEYLDRMQDVAIEMRGCSGLGAGARLEATFSEADPGDDDTAGESVESVGDVVFQGLPIGDLRELRRFINIQHRSTVWDGHNRIQSPSCNSEELLNRVRGR